MASDPRRTAMLHRRVKWVWVILMIPTGIAYFVLDAQTFTAAAVLVTAELTLYDTFLGHASAEQGAEGRFPEDD